MESNSAENLLLSLLSTYFDTEFETVNDEKSDDADDCKTDMDKDPEKDDESSEKEDENPEEDDENSGKDDKNSENNDKENQNNMADILKFFNDEDQESLSEILYFEPNELVLKKYKPIKEKKFCNTISYKTNSLINYIKRNGTSHHAKFFYIILYHLNNQNKFKISSAAKIIDEFININSDSKIALYKALKHLNDEKAAIDVIENVILLLQFLYS